MPRHVGASFPRTSLVPDLSLLSLHRVAAAKRQARTMTAIPEGAVALIEQEACEVCQEPLGEESTQGTWNQGGRKWTVQCVNHHLIHKQCLLAKIVRSSTQLSRENMASFESYTSCAVCRQPIPDEVLKSVGVEVDRTDKSVEYNATGTDQLTLIPDLPDLPRARRNESDGDSGGEDHFGQPQDEYDESDESDESDDDDAALPAVPNSPPVALSPQVPGVYTTWYQIGTYVPHLRSGTLVSDYKQFGFKLTEREPGPRYDASLDISILARSRSNSMLVNLLSIGNDESGIFGDVTSFSTNSSESFVPEPPGTLSAGNLGTYDSRNRRRESPSSTFWDIWPQDAVARTFATSEWEMAYDSFKRGVFAVCKEIVTVVGEPRMHYVFMDSNGYEDRHEAWPNPLYRLQFDKYYYPALAIKYATRAGDLEDGRDLGDDPVDDVVFATGEAVGVDVARAVNRALVLALHLRSRLSQLQIDPILYRGFFVMIDYLLHGKPFRLASLDGNSRFKTMVQMLFQCQWQITVLLARANLCLFYDRLISSESDVLKQDPDIVNLSDLVVAIDQVMGLRRAKSLVFDEITNYSVGSQDWRNRQFWWQALPNPSEWLSGDSFYKMPENFSSYSLRESSAIALVAGYRFPERQYRVRSSIAYSVRTLRRAIDEETDEEEDEEDTRETRATRARTAAVAAA